MQEHSDSPDDPYLSRFAHALGYGGLLPVGVCVGLVLMQPEWSPPLLRVGVIYTGTILCFLGGIQWGFALRSPLLRVRIRRLCVGVMASLWSAGCLLLPIALCVPLLIGGLVCLLVYEFVERAEDFQPPWYRPLRLQLTAGLSTELALLYLIA